MDYQKIINWLENTPNQLSKNFALFIDCISETNNDNNAKAVDVVTLSII